MNHQAFRHTARNSALLVIGSIALAACGGGGGEDTGRLTLGVTDAPVDEANAVVVQFRGVELKPQSGDRIEHVFDAPMQIDLLALQGSERALLLDGLEVPAGPYNFIRLMVDAQRGVFDSYIELTDGSQVSLFVPSGNQSGLQLSGGLTVAAGGLTDFTIDFDLRKSVTNPQGQDDYTLKPSLRLVDNAQVGAITGTVDSALLSDPGCSNNLDDDTGHAVYLFEAAATPDDYGSAAEPLTAALVNLDGDSGEYRYEIGFVLAGEYLVAVTCQAADDEPETDDDIAFGASAAVTVTADSTASADLAPTP